MILELSANVLVPIGAGSLKFVGENFFKFVHNVSHRNDGETARAAGAVQNFFVRFRINHPDDHFHDVARRKKFSAIPAQIGTDNFFVSFALDVDVGIEQAVLLQFADDAGKTARRKVERIGVRENLRVTHLDAGKNFFDAIFDDKLTVGIFTFARRGVKFQFVRNVLFVFDLAKNNLEELEKRLVLVKTVVAVNVIVTRSEHEQ